VIDATTKAVIVTRGTPNDNANIIQSRACSPPLPTISIVTICKNAGATIGRTLESVIRCDYPHLEYIIVDGGSTDDTLERISRYRSRVDKLVSEPDQGISDALNKAVALTTGRYHLVVHADDVLIPESLATLGQGRGIDARVICGSVLVMKQGAAVRKFDPDPLKLVRKMSVPHMGALIRKDAWESAGRYDTRRKIAMDHLLMLRILMRFGVSAFSLVDTVVANYSLGGVSDRQVDLGFREVRDNLIEEGLGSLRANAAYLELRVRSIIARAIGKG
jgi:glycosyltransferase involved in cell wall biosynthesis